MTNWYKYKVTGQTTDGKTETRTIVQMSELTAKLAYYCMIENVIPESRKVVCLGRTAMPEDVKQKQKMLQGLERVFNPDITFMRY